MASVTDDVVDLDGVTLPEVLGRAVGPSIENLTHPNRGVGEKAMRAGAGLASIFTSLPAALLTHSPEAEASLFPAPKNLAKFGDNAKRRGLISDTDLLRKHGLVHDGHGWNVFKPDYPLQSEAKKLENAVNRHGWGISRVKDRYSTDTTGLPPEHVEALHDIGDTRIDHDKFLRGSLGTFRRNKNGGSGSIEVNTHRSVNRTTPEGNRYSDINRVKRSSSSMQNTEWHELQHALDQRLGRSFGDIRPTDVRLNDKAGYAHNVGEIRGRLNTLLNQKVLNGFDRDPYIGLQEVFPQGMPVTRTKIWGD